MELTQISIHALHTECDSENGVYVGGKANFNPRTPYRVRPVRKFGEPYFRDISIHALHTECDPPMDCTFLASTNFNPRTPYGVRRLPDASSNDTE